MTSTTTSPQRPNIVLIFMDDMGYGDLGCTGSPLIRTPRMDSVAEDGMTFTQMYSAAPTCTPSRAALLTGRYAQRAGLPRVIFPDDPAGLSDQEVTIAEVLGEQGYACGAFGKWHLGARTEHSPLRHGFDRFVGLPYSNDMHPVVLHVDQEIEEDVDSLLENVKGLSATDRVILKELHGIKQRLDAANRGNGR